jgi:hypothetical protein
VTDHDHGIAGSETILFCTYHAADLRASSLHVSLVGRRRARTDTAAVYFRTS